MKKKITLQGILGIQLAVVIYTLNGIFAKLASGQDFLSFKFILYYGMEIAILGIYAIIWQQIIKRYDLSIAYVNRAMAIFWSTFWAFLFFKEQITFQNILGIVVIFIGIMVVNSDEC